MKYPMRFLRAVSLALALLLFAASCSSTPSDTEHGTQTPHIDSSESTDGEKHTAGGITYEKITEKTTYPAYDSTQVGKVARDTQVGVTTLFASDFSSGDSECGGDAASRTAGAAGVADGVMYIPYDAESATHIKPGGWTTWSPTVAAPNSKYLQTQLTLDWSVYTSQGGAWMSAFWGCYVSDYAGKIPDNPGDGLWFSFNPTASAVTVYGADVTSWPTGIASVSVPEGVMDGRFKTHIVCTPERATYVYAENEASEPFLLCRVTFSEGNMNIYDGGDALVKKVQATTDSLAGEHFTLFVHGGGCAGVDDIQILACSKGEVTEKTTVKVTAADGVSLGLDMTDKTDLVSICYSVWFDAILGSGSEEVTDFNNITEVLEGKREWGGVPSFHYWAKPAQGYYRSSDRTAVRNNMSMLAEAGVDFVIIDLTNANDGYMGTAAWTTFIKKPMDALLDEILLMRADGLASPYVVFWAGSSTGALIQALYDTYFSDESRRDCFVYWDSKPFILTSADISAFPMKNEFTVRYMWGLYNNSGVGNWSFLNIDNRDTVSRDENGQAEQVSVAVAAQETYMSEPTAHGRNHGIFWYNQWKYAFEVRPKVVTLTWWNEWAAQRLLVDGKYVFTDNYNAEYSRDIEPMTGGHEDKYYKWLIQYIEAYKSNAPCPVLVDEGYEGEAD